MTTPLSRFMSKMMLLVMTIAINSKWVMTLISNVINNGDAFHAAMATAHVTRVSSRALSAMSQECKRQAC
eukprot:7540587-Prorocentrum_lima.AAC.1